MNNLITINKQEQTLQLNIEWQDKRDNLLKEISQIGTINNQDDNDKVGSYLKKVQKHSNLLEKARTEISKPINARLKALKKISDTARMGLEKEKSRLKGLLSDFAYSERERLRRIEEEKAMREAQERAKREAEIEKLRQEELEKHKEDVFYNSKEDVIIQQKEAEHQTLSELADKNINLNVKVKTQNTTSIVTWSFEIIDENKIPHCFMQPNLTKIGEFVRKNKDKATISGIKVVKKESVRIR